MCNSQYLKHKVSLPTTINLFSRQNSYLQYPTNIISLSKRQVGENDKLLTNEVT